MSDQTDNLLNLVKPYGLSDEEGKLYLFLLQNGFSTALQTSRVLHMGRTKVYRLLDKLKAKELVEFKVEDKGMSFGATSPQKFQQLVAVQEQQTIGLKNSLPHLLQQLNQLTNHTATKSKVLYYEGVEGLKQVSYNITRAYDLLRVFEMEHLSEFVPVDFAEAIRQKLVDKKVMTYDLTNKTFFPGFTQVTKMIPNYSQFRHIDPQHLQINFEVLIYNDVYATYTYKDKNIFCVEIYNQQLAEMQKQLFDYIWSRAVPMKFLDKTGAASVI